LHAPGEPNATNLDSWLAVAQNGTVTVFTSKVDLGTGVVTALAQIVAEELDVPFASIHMDVGDTSKAIDQPKNLRALIVQMLVAPVPMANGGRRLSRIMQRQSWPAISSSL
jgi:CO/xanthine dehydrogenase Mo-binding subunit